MPDPCAQGRVFEDDHAHTPEAESATRLAQQFAQLAKGSAVLDGRSEVDEADYKNCVQRVAFDCIPAVRRTLLDTLIGGNFFPA